MAATAIVDVKMVQKANIYGYSRERLMNFMKISTTSPSYLNAVRKIFETGFAFGRFKTRSYATFESNMPIVLRFMVDSHITGMNWLELPAKKFTLRKGTDKTSNSQFEADVL